MSLVYKNERPLYFLVLLFSLIFWLAFIAATVGVILIFLLFGFFAYLFTHSGFVAHIKGTGVKVSENQFAELHIRYKRNCKKLGVDKIPDLYIVNSDGILNAFATRFLRRHYVILYSSVIDALKKYPDSLDFYIGHELGHIKRGHLNWTTLIWPGTLLPIIGAAFSRAREYTCDLHGLECCAEPKVAAYGLAVLATGPEHWNKLNIQSFAKQSEESGGFWMSFHELTGTYPWLCKRMQHIMAASQSKVPRFPRRNPFAYFFAMFIPNTGMGGGAGLMSLMVFIAVIGILASVAIPAYHDYTVRTKTADVFILSEQVTTKATTFIQKNGHLPNNLQAIGLPEDLSNGAVKAVQVSKQGFTFVLVGDPALEDKTIIFQPIFKDSDIQWNCVEGNLEKKYRPARCRDDFAKLIDL